MMEANDGNGEEMASPQKFIDLLECIVDYDGNALYSQNKLSNVWNKRWNLERTKANDRTRCKKTQQKVMVLEDLTNKRYFVEKL